MRADSVLSNAGGTISPRGGWNAQNSRSDSSINGSTSAVATSALISTSGAPLAIQSVNWASSPEVITFTPDGKSLSRGGISSEWIRFRIRLSSGLPKTIAGPDFPPLSIVAFVRKSKLASRRPAPWQTVHLSNMIGSITCWFTSAASMRDAGSVPSLNGDPDLIHVSITCISSDESGSPSPSGGICLSWIRWYR